MGDMLNTGLAVIAFATLAFLGLQRGRITDLKERLTEEREDNASKERRLAEKDREIGDERTKITELQSRVEVLASTVTGEVHWVALEGKFDENQRAVLGVLSELRDLLTEIRDLTNRS